MTDSLWQFLHRRVPCGANWRYSRFAIVRRLGDWWLPRWYGLGVALDETYECGGTRRNPCQSCLTRKWCSRG